MTTANLLIAKQNFFVTSSAHDSVRTTLDPAPIRHNDTTIPQHRFDENLFATDGVSETAA